MTGIANAASESTELIFLSHSGADTQAAKELAGLLRQGGVEVWLDVERLAAGDVWMDELEAALVSAKRLIVYIGPSGVRNWVGREVRFALDRSTQDRSSRLIPVLGPGADAEALPLFLKQHQWLDLRDPVVLPQELKRLLQSVTGLEPGEISLLAPNQSPFRGLFAFEQEALECAQLGADGKRDRQLG
jgi:hypothetical protein